MKNSYFANRQQGMTLLEILIAMALGTFLLAGVIQIFLSSKQSYRMQESMSRLQENGRFAMEFISRDIRMADYWGCVGSATDIENKIAAPPAASINGIAGLENDNGGNDGDANNDENGNNIWDGTDSITLTGASSGTRTNLIGAGADTDADFSIASETDVRKQFVQNDLALVSNCSSGDIFQITNDVKEGTTVSHVAGLGVGSANTDVYGAGSQVYKLNIATYQIRSSASVPALYRRVNSDDDDDFEPLVGGIENMQILYGEDTSGDGTPNYYVDADTVANMDEVVSVRITLIARTADSNLSSSGDGRLRRTFSSTLVLRNRLQ